MASAGERPVPLWEPLARDGRFCHGSMARERITEGEILSAVRANGAEGIEAVSAVILESDGSISVLTNRPS
ncbi:hypothetical protein GCM10011505_18150 [Tistrella bauzanensis]|uniref:YetF C-terminal domain-containing protein n=1 Tax=Tistrella bauzanensis TaxID=657419 RepID=A0ABQ1IGI4_9PROT|nr:YetF domain-containing protein [Tistrella bauzanensis]GGB37077.1 hypothetical protein GCM10011505_18150 [Tistrella bauzanensis]